MFPHTVLSRLCGYYNFTINWQTEWAEKYLSSNGSPSATNDINGGRPAIHCSHIALVYIIHREQTLSISLCCCWLSLSLYLFGLFVISVLGIRHFK